jgi:hypothetical protein
VRAYKKSPTTKKERGGENMKKEKYFYVITHDDEMEHIAEIAETLTECAQWLNVSKQAVIKARANNEAVKHYKIHKIKE